VGAGQLFPGPGGRREGARAPGRRLAGGREWAAGLAGRQVRSGRGEGPLSLVRATGQPGRSTPARPHRNRASPKEQLLRSLEGSRPPWHQDGGGALGPSGLCAARPSGCRFQQASWPLECLSSWKPAATPSCPIAAQAQVGTVSLGSPNRNRKTQSWGSPFWHPEMFSWTGPTFWERTAQRQEGQFSCPAAILPAASSSRLSANSKPRSGHDQGPPPIALPGAWELVRRAGELLYK
jgi:hypothetical protein